MKFWRIQWGRHVAQMGWQGMHTRICWGNFLTNLKDRKRVWEDNIKIDLIKVGGEWNWLRIVFSVRLLELAVSRAVIHFNLYYSVIQFHPLSKFRSYSCYVYFNIIFTSTSLSNGIFYAGYPIRIFYSCLTNPCIQFLVSPEMRDSLRGTQCQN